MDESEATLPLAPAPLPMEVVAAPIPRPQKSVRQILVAAFQVFLVCGVPTQLTVALVLAFKFQMPIMQGENISFEFFAVLSLLDTALIALLIRLFLLASKEDSRTVFFGRRRIGPEVLRGLLLLPVVFVAVTGIVMGLRAVAPWTHTVSVNPVEAYMQTPFESAILIVVVILAGGLREELQRAFILHRFDQWLGGMKVGLVLFTLWFGALHADQGIDVAVAVGTLGLLWGFLYMKRGSAAAAMANHASFDVAQILQVVIVKALGG